MHSEIKTYIRTKSGLKLMTIFGYTSSSVPAIEIIGLGSMGRLIKEKIIYLSRVRGIKIKPLKYVISIEANNHSGTMNVDELELPILLVFWHLSGVLSISSLQDCLCAGQVRIDGRVIQKNFEEHHVDQFQTQIDLSEMKLISESANDTMWNIQTSKLLDSIPQMSFASA